MERLRADEVMILWECDININKPTIHSGCFNVNYTYNGKEWIEYSLETMEKYTKQTHL
jgi:hypothetical protein